MGIDAGVEQRGALGGRQRRLLDVSCRKQLIACRRCQPRRRHEFRERIVVERTKRLLVDQCAARRVEAGQEADAESGGLQPFVVIIVNTAVGIARGINQSRAKQR